MAADGRAQEREEGTGSAEAQQGDADDHGRER